MGAQNGSQARALDWALLHVWRLVVDKTRRQETQSTGWDTEVPELSQEEERAVL